MPDKLQALYDNLTKLNPDFKVPVDQFRQDMQDENKLKTLHSNLSKNYPDFKVGYDQFKSDMWSTNPTPAPATAPAVPVEPVGAPVAESKTAGVEFPDLTPAGLSFQEKPLTAPGGMTSVLPTELPKVPEIRQTVGATKLATDPLQVFEQKNIVPAVEQAAAAKPEEYFQEGIKEVAGAAQPAQAPQLSTVDALKVDYIRRTKGEDAAVKFEQELQQPSFIPKLGKVVGSGLMAGTASLGSWVADTPGFIYNLAGDVFRAAGMDVKRAEEFKGGALEQVSDYFKKQAAGFEKKLDEVNPNRSLGIQNAFETEGIGAGILNLSESIAQSLPASIAMILGGGSTLPTILSSATVFGAGKAQEMAKLAPEMNADKRDFIAAINGSLEGVFETLLGSGAVARSLKSIIKKEGAEVAKSQVKKSLGDIFSKMLTENPWLAPLGGGFEEIGTQISQNIVDKYSGYRPDIKITDGVVDVAWAGIGMGGLHGTAVGLAKATMADQKKGEFVAARNQAGQVVRQNFDALAQPDGNLHVGVDKNGNEVVIVSQTPGGMAILQDGTIVDIADINDIQLHPFESIFGQQMAEFDATNDPDLQPAVVPQVQTTFNWNGRTMQLTDVSDKNDLMVQEIDTEGEPVGRPEKISAEEYRKVIEQQVDTPETQAELRTYNIDGKDIPFTPQADGSLVSESFTSPEEAETAKTDLEKQIGASNTVAVNTVPGPDSLAPATYQLSVTPKTLEDQLFKEGESSYVLNGQPIERGKALARVKSAIFDGNRKKIENLEISGDKELTDMIEKAFPVKITIGKKKASAEDALNWIDAADTLEELRKLNIEGAPATNDIRTAYVLKVKELVPEVSPEESDKMLSELFAPETPEQKIEQPIKTEENDSTNIEGIPSGEPRREPTESARPDQTGGGREAATGRNVQGDGQVVQETREAEREGRTEIRAEDKGPQAATGEQGLKPSFQKKKVSPSKLADLYKTRLTKLKKDDPETYWSVDLPSDADLLSAAKDGRLIDMNGGMAYVTKDGDLKGLFKYDPNAKGTAKALQAERIKMGGIKLDAFDTEGTGKVSLVPTYKKNGFREVARVDFNEEFAPEDMPENVKAMKPDVVVMVYDPENKLPIKERRFNKDQYEDALAYRDSYITEEPKPDHNKSADTQAFFSDVVTGTSDKFKPKKPWEPILPFTEKEQAVRPVFEKFNGNFDTHIATSIPAFRDVQIKVVSALNQMYGKKGGLIYDIGGSEGGFVKAITELSDGRMKSINLDANGDMEAVHNATPVEGSTFIKEAFGEGFEWDGVNYPRHEPKQKADVVHESMTFQFIDEKRADKVNEVVDNYLKPDGLFITEEKVHPKSQEQWAANEAKKDTDFKSRYYESGQISAKKEEVLTGMVTNQTSYDRYKNELRKRFDYVEEYWDGGNFKGLVASNDKAKVDQFLSEVGNTDTEFSEKNISVGGKPSFRKKGGYTIVELRKNPMVMWHGSPSGDMRGGTTGLHVGSYQAAKEALEARIGVPATGEWDGSKTYGETKIAGRKTLAKPENKWKSTGYNAGRDVPEEDYYPSERESKAKYSDGSIVSEDSRPNIQPVEITGEMTNTRSNPHTDTRANALMRGSLKKGNAKRGYFYTNEGEDVGSISAVIPGPEFIRVIPTAAKKPFSFKSLVKEAAVEVDTNPTDAQKEAGNYKMGHVTLHGMDISIETPKGAMRSGTDEDGKVWETESKTNYGYFKGTVGKDGDHVDVHIGDKPDSTKVFVIDQVNPKTGEFDESKVMLGFDTAEEAKAAYMSNYEEGWNGFGKITETPMDQFKTWLYDGARQLKPFGEYSEVKRPVSFQARKLYAGLEKTPEFKDLPELTAWLQKWSKKNKVFASEEAKADDDKFVKALVKHTIEELKAFEELSDYPYVGFYDYDIPARLNPELARFAETRYGHELSPAQVALYHLVSGFASPSADPVMDSSKGLDVFDKYMRTGKLTSASDKQATVWEVNEQGKKVDTGKPKFDEQGNPVFSQVTLAYATPSLNKFRDNVLGHFKGDLDKAIDWITSVHSYEEIARIMGVPVKGKGSLEEHENLTKADGGFGIFGFTGPKLGSYILNRLGNFSTVTKDLWYARTMARLTSESLQEKSGEALKLPWNLTVEGKRKRALADKAWTIVADKLNITPADVQQRMWEFEKRLYEKLGAKGSSGTTGYASEGFLKRAKELEPALYEPFQPAKPSYKKREVEVTGVEGQDGQLKANLQKWETESNMRNPVHVMDNNAAADFIQGVASEEFVQDVRDTEFWGMTYNNEIFVHPDTPSSEALVTWAHEKSHIAFESGFESYQDEKAYCEAMHDYLGIAEIRRVLPVEYWFDEKSQQAKEYLAALVEDVITEGGLLENSPEFIKSIIFEQINQFSSVKYLQDEKQRLDKQERGQTPSETVTGGLQETAGVGTGEQGISDGGVQPVTAGKAKIAKAFSFEDLFEPSYQKKEGETMNVDGIERPRLNSNGQPIHSTEEGIRNFWRWFGDSKVVDESGRPLVVYHGTPNGGFNSFSKETKGTRTNHSSEDVGFHFTNDKDYASAYSLEYRKIAYPALMETLGYIPEASKAPDNAMTYNVYLSLQNPMFIDYSNAINKSIIDKAINNNQDGIIGKIGETVEYVVFSPSQIKSATGNFGGFDPNDPRISYRRKRELSPDRKQVLTTGEHIREILVNNKLALENWMKDVETVVPTIEDYENPLLKDALAKSKVTHKLRVFEKGAYKNLINSVANVLKTSGITKEELSHYLIAVHGQERNKRFWDNNPDRVGEDFSGLTELKKVIRAKATPAEQLAIDGMNNEAFAEYYQKQIESKLDPSQVKELWNSIREISKLVRDEMLDSGMISREYYDELNTMYKNYIPLRAWEDSNPEDFEFSRGVGSYTEPIIRAKGRKSLAEDPLATLLQMANTAYISGERNRVKQAAGELVRNNAAALKDVVQYNRTYFINQGTDAQGNPIIQETIDRPDQELFDHGLVTTKVPKQYTARRTSAQAKEFEVEFYRGGKKYVLVFQGSDPAVARAINNKEASVGLDYLNKVVGTDVKIGKITIPSINKMSRYLSSINTTYSVDFPLVNFVRDAPMALLSEWVYGDAKEVAKMFPNMKNAEAAMRRMLRGKADPANNPIDAQLEDFFKAGGPTGFAFLKNVDEFKQSITNDVRRINRIKNPLVRMEVGFRRGLDLIGQLAEWSETITRFGVYLNHVQAGESKEKAALAAKNATVNFDQKGRISPALNGLYTFFNAAVQAVDKYFKLWGRNPYKMAGVHMFLMVQAFINAMMLDLYGGEDDDEVKNYDKVSDYTKRNNLVIPVPGTDKTVSIAVPQILRKFHAIGFDAYDLLSGRKTAEQVMLDELASIPSDISPIDAEAFLNGDGDLSMKPLVPSILRPIVELEANENFMKMPIVPEPFSIEMAHKIADTRRAYKDVNKIAQWTTDKLYELGGGDETGFKYVYDNGELHNVPALLDTSPESIEHLFESYFGGVGKLANRTWKTTGNIFGAGKKLYEGENFQDAIKEIDINTVPIANRFVRTPIGDPLQKEFKKVRNDMENKIKVLDQAEKDGDWTKFQKMYEEIGGKVNDYKAIMTTFENLDKAYSIVAKEDKKAAEDLKSQMREQMKEIVKLK